MTKLQLQQRLPNVDPYNIGGSSINQHQVIIMFQNVSAPQRVSSPSSDVSVPLQNIPALYLLFLFLCHVPFNIGGSCISNQQSVINVCQNASSVHQNVFAF